MPDRHWLFWFVAWCVGMTIIAPSYYWAAKARVRAARDELNRLKARVRRQEA